jgi:hypothetical protein
LKYVFLYFYYEAHGESMARIKLKSGLVDTPPKPKKDKYKVVA